MTRDLRRYFYICLALMIMSSGWLLQSTQQQRTSVCDYPSYEPSKQQFRQIPSSNPDSSMIVYLSQGPAKSYRKLARRFADIPKALFFYHSYDKDCEGCLFHANSTLDSGRNFVLKHAWKYCQRNDIDAKYFIVFDDDIDVKCIRSNGTDHDSNCWQAQHDILLSEKSSNLPNGWPLLAPKYYVDDDQEGLAYHTCRDDSLWIMRQDHVHFLYPFSTRHSDKSWQINVLVSWYKMDRCFPNGFLTLPQFRNVNARHGEYPKGPKLKLALDILQHEYDELGPWTTLRQDLKRFRCHVRWSKPLFSEMSPACWNFTKTRFDQWIRDEYDP